MRLIGKDENRDKEVRAAPRSIRRQLSEPNKPQPRKRPRPEPRKPIGGMTMVQFTVEEENLILYVS